MERILLYREEGKPVVTLDQYVVRHSPTGFNWGYEGSGPADLALNILVHFIGVQRAEKEGLYQHFKREVVARIPDEGGEITEAQVREWLKRKGINA